MFIESDAYKLNGSGFILEIPLDQSRRLFPVSRKPYLCTLHP